MKTARVALALMLGLGLMIGSAAAQDAETKKPRRSTLSKLQREINSRMKQLEEIMDRLIDQLEKQDLEKATRLRKALKVSRKQAVLAFMKRISGLLNKDPKKGVQTSKALDDQEALLKILEDVLETLMQSSEIDARQKKINDLKAFIKRLKDLRKKEEANARQSEKLSAAERKVAALRKAAKKIEDLLNKQKKTHEQTTDADKSGALGKQGAELSKEQDSLAKQAQKMAKSLSKALGKSGKEAAKALSSASNKMGGAAKSLSKAGKSGKSGGKSGAKSGAKSGGKAGGKSGGKAGGKSGGKAGGKQAMQQQKDAIKDLKKALDAIKKELKQARKLLALPEKYKKMAKKEGQAESEAQKMAKELGKKDIGQPGQPKPGQNALNQAGKSMKGAGSSLGKQSGSKALPQQKQAVKKLKQAEQELEQILAQLKKDQQDEILAALQERFSRMLRVQIKIWKATVRFNQKKTAGRFNNLDRLAVGRLSDEERTLAHSARTALEILKEEGTTVIFPGVVEQMKSDIENVSRRLARAQVGMLTQTFEKEIIATLKELIEALKKLRQQREAQANGQSGSGGPPPDADLVPLSAELKMIRALQLRVNRLTKAVQTEKKRLGKVDRDLDGQYESLSKKEKAISKITEELGRKLAQEDR